LPFHADKAADEEFRAFVVARWPSLLRTAYLLTGDHGHAEDLVQNALVRTHRHWRRIERTDAPEVFVRKVMVNLNSSRWRRSRLREDLTDLPPDRPGHRRDDVADYDRRDELWQSVLTLPPRMRATLVLRYFEDLPEAEVARVMGCSVGSVKTQTSRGLERLRSRLGLAAEPATTAGTTQGSQA
jgi:RNA polymerase sigma-70 factor (sigma-E family)